MTPYVTPPQVTHALASPCKIQDVKEFGLKNLLLEHRDEVQRKFSGTRLTLTSSDDAGGLMECADSRNTFLWTIGCCETS